MGSGYVGTVKADVRVEVHQPMTLAYMPTSKERHGPVPGMSSEKGEERWFRSLSERS